MTNLTIADGWIATHVSGKVLHFSTHDGWTVQQVVGEIDAHHQLTMAQLVARAQELENQVRERDAKIALLRNKLDRAAARAARAE